jgi:hypothetical protein
MHCELRVQLLSLCRLWHMALEQGSGEKLVEAEVL